MLPQRKPIAKPPLPPHYVIPRSHKLDPPYSWWWPQTGGRWPFPRMPLPFETESRAKGTGLIWGRRKCPRCGRWH